MIQVGTQVRITRRHIDESLHGLEGEVLATNPFRVRPVGWIGTAICMSYEVEKI